MSMYQLGDLEVGRDGEHSPGVLGAGCVLTRHLWLADVGDGVGPRREETENRIR